MTERPTIVINADDFGIAPNITEHIVRCFNAGRITSTSVLANLPDCEDACRAAQRHGFADRIGLHVNLVFGPPLSERSRPFCSAKGELAFPSRVVVAPPGATTAAYHEIRAQLERLRKLGIRPTHLDSHQHFINGFPYARAALAAAREFGIRRIRPARNLFYKLTLPKVVLKTLYNRYLRSSGFITTRHFCDFKPYLLHVNAGGGHARGPIELMCHPGARLDPSVYGVANETDLLLSSAFGEFLAGVDLVPYADIGRSNTR